MAKLTKQQWADARKVWGLDPREGHQWLADELVSQGFDVNRVTIAKAAKRQGWEKITQGEKVTERVTQKVTQVEKKSLKKVTKPKPKDNAKPVPATKTISTECVEHAERGRPTLYKPEYAEQVEEFCKMGATDATLAEHFDVTEQTINNWKREHPDFFESMKAGKVFADAKMASALYKSGMGLHVTTEDKLVSDGSGGQEVVTLEKQIEPSVAAQRYWLNNRQPKHWRDKVEAPVEINLNVFPAKEVLDGIYARALEEAAKRDQQLIGRRERLGILIEHD